MNRKSILTLAALCLGLTTLALLAADQTPKAASDDTVDAARRLSLHLRTRKEIASETGRFEVVQADAQWDARQTAVIICDLWDKHWCESATRRTGEMAPRIEQFVSAVRAKGGFIVHAPSDTMKTYEGTPGRKMAMEAPMANATLPFKWNYIDPAYEAKLPIDDKDGGCDDEPQCKNYRAWKGEHPAVRILEGDAISDQGQEIWNLFEQKGIKNVLYVGVHTNMCVLGRSFGIRMMHRLGKNVALVRDLTDTMYNPRQAPFVPHRMGTQLVIEHVEKFWCPTIHSSDILGDAKRANVVIIAAEQEYQAKETLPAFAKEELEAKLNCRATVLISDDVKRIEGLEALDNADLLILFARRRELPPEQLNRVKAYIDSGRPVIGLRTASHAFQGWLEFDKQVLGGNYQNHYNNKQSMTAHIKVIEKAANDPILRGVTPTEFDTNGSLYKNAPIAETSFALLSGTWTEKPAEPVAWTNTYKSGRIFYTSLGHPDDFKTAQFRRLLSNAVLWALDRPIAQ